MRVGILTREYPPEVYGGAGVHVEYLVRELRRLPDLDVDVHCFGAPRAEPGVHAYRPDPAVRAAAGAVAGPEVAALETVAVDVLLAAGVLGGDAAADVVHSHTWYGQFGGHLARVVSGRPHVATVHSLEPLRPWKAEQLGGGYRLSSWCERTALEAADAVIAVSAGMRADVLAAYPAIDPTRVHVITNGIDTEEYAPGADAEAVLARHGIDPHRPLVLFVGRITRQKGLVHLLAAARHLPPEAQLVLCAGAPDTPAIGAEVAGLVAELQERRNGVIWISAMLARPDVIALLGAATVFVCPSIYEPLGIVNLEAMACATAVVASAVGGIPEVVQDGVTGLLVPYQPADTTGTPADPAGFARDLGSALSAVLEDPERSRRLGLAGRERAVAEFGWDRVARRTAELYAELLA